MSLRILFADDSMTAQSMGKKILSDAGYEVIAVSNGAAAVKKIAEQKPDIIILDVYMPGYSGLEVCEKIRASMDTLKTPVLLTYGKMEHYRPEDGHRVRADGVIVKPFEASDLLAIIKKLEERVSRNSPREEQAVLVERARQREAEVAAEASENAVEVADPAHFAPPIQSTVEVPDHMAGSSAFGDLLNSEPAFSNSTSSNSTPAVAEAIPPPMPARVPVPEYEIPVSWRDEPEPETHAEVSAPEVSAPEPVMQSIPVDSAVAEPEAVAPPPPPPPAPELVVAHVTAPAETEPSSLELASPEPEPPLVTTPAVQSDPSQSYSPFGGARPLRIPVYQEPEPPANSYEFMPTSTPAPTEIDIPREPQLQETAEETTRSTVAEAVEPGLMTTRQQFEWEQDQAQAEPAERASIETAELPPLAVEAPSAHLQDIPADIAAYASPANSVELPRAPEAAVVAAVPPPLAPATQVSAVPAPPPAPLSEIAEARLSEDDFEARVAAAMAAYKAAGPDAPLGGYEEAEPEVAETVAFAAMPSHESPFTAQPVEPPQPEVSSHQHQQAAEPEIAAEPEYRVPTFEYRPPVSSPKPVRDFEPARIAAEPHLVDESTEVEMHPVEANAAVDHASAPMVESVVRAAAAAAGPGADHEAISQAVHRAMEKLKPDLVQEILRELKSKE